MSAENTPGLFSSNFHQKPNSNMASPLNNFKSYDTKYRNVFVNKA